MNDESDQAFRWSRLDTSSIEILSCHEKVAAIQARQRIRDRWSNRLSREDTEKRLLIVRETEYSAKCEHFHISNNVSESKTTFRDETELRQDHHHVFNLWDESKVRLFIKSSIITQCRFHTHVIDTKESSLVDTRKSKNDHLNNVTFATVNLMKIRKSKSRTWWKKKINANTTTLRTERSERLSNRAHTNATIWES
jgi:hypothetical protein